MKEEAWRSKKYDEEVWDKTYMQYGCGFVSYHKFMQLCILQ